MPHKKSYVSSIPLRLTSSSVGRRIFLTGSQKP
nr:MAG TPA: hypothetical protein [Caudoviricetes sp.]